MSTKPSVVIIGGGVIGLSIAFHLARAGIRDVVVLERLPELARGSSDKPPGGFRHQFTSEMNVRLSLESIRRLDTLAAETGAAIAFDRRGYLLVTSSPETLDQIQQDAVWQGRLGVPIDILDRRGISQVAPELAVEDLVGGTFCPLDGWIDPRSLALAFAAGARGAGVDIRLGEAVQRCQVRNGRIATVGTDRQEYAAAAVVVAAGSWSAEVVAMMGIGLPLGPRRRSLWLAQGASPRTASHPFMVDLDTGLVLVERDNGLIFGIPGRPVPGESASFEDRAEEEVLPVARAAAEHRMPVLAQSTIARSWAGAYEMTPDANPIIGRLGPENLLVAAGFSGHGVMHSPAVGRIVAELVADGQATGVDLGAYAPGRFSTGLASEARVF